MKVTTMSCILLGWAVGNLVVSIWGDISLKDTIFMICLGALGLITNIG